MEEIFQTPIETRCVGIHESGLILQSALRAAFEDLRAKPYLLDFCFNQLKTDPILNQDYGADEVEKAKRWFLETRIPIFNTGRLNKATFPCVSLKVVASNESENSLADIDQDPREESAPQWPSLAGPFDAVAYDPKTGKLTIPKQSIVTGRGQMVVTRTGKSFEIQSTPDDTTLVIDKQLREDFAAMTIRGQKQSFITSLESAEFAETYMVGCHAPAEPSYAAYLHSITKFALLMYRESLLETRNFERSSISSTAEGDKEQTVDSGEIVYSRYLQLSGFVKAGWPKVIAPKVTALKFQLRFAGGGKVTTIESTPAWLGDEDPLADN